MERIPEPELMDSSSQACAYANADFEEPHSRFITLFQEAFSTKPVSGYVLDLGCGPGDITIRFARAFPDCTVEGIDGSCAMLSHAELVLSRATDVRNQVRFIRAKIPSDHLPRERYQIIISNSLLHHLPEPSVLWETIKQYSSQGTLIFVQDLMRPATQEKAHQLVEFYAGREPDILKKDFFNSLCAAFEVEEVREQLYHAGLHHLLVRTVSDRHLAISGHMP